MSNLLNYDSKFTHIFSKVIDAVLLGMLWLIFSLPVFTLGAASSAFYYAFQKSIRQGNGYSTREFFHGFKANFKQATVLWLILLALCLVLLMDLYILTGGVLDIGQLAPLLTVTSVLIFAIVIMWGVCAFPYIARFENDIRGMIKNSLIITLANLHWALLLLVLLIGCAVLFFVFPVMALFMPTLYMLPLNWILERIFRKFMSPEDLEAQREVEVQA